MGLGDSNPHGIMRNRRRYVSSAWVVQCRRVTVCARPLVLLQHQEAIVIDMCTGVYDSATTAAVGHSTKQELGFVGVKVSLALEHTTRQLHSSVHQRIGATHATHGPEVQQCSTAPEGPIASGTLCRFWPWLVRFQHRVVTLFFRKRGLSFVNGVLCAHLQLSAP